MKGFIKKGEAPEAGGIDDGINEQFMHFISSFSVNFIKDQFIRFHFNRLNCAIWEPDSIPMLAW